MQNILINMHEKFHYDRLRNDRALGNRKSDNNNNNNDNSVRDHWGSVSGFKLIDVLSAKLKEVTSLFPAWFMHKLTQSHFISIRQESYL